jgi:hypothetical protein
MRSDCLPFREGLGPADRLWLLSKLFLPPVSPSPIFRLGRGVYDLDIVMSVSDHYDQEMSCKLFLLPRVFLRSPMSADATMKSDMTSGH